MRSCDADNAEDLGHLVSPESTRGCQLMGRVRTGKYPKVETVLLLAPGGYLMIKLPNGDVFKVTAEWARHELSTKWPEIVNAVIEEQQRLHSRHRMDDLSRLYGNGEGAA